MVADVVTTAIDISGGRIPLPMEPGLGVSLNEENLERYRAKGAPRYRRARAAAFCVQCVGVDVYDERYKRATSLF
jgi:hypothetical protein